MLERYCQPCQRSRYMYQLPKVDPTTGQEWCILQCGKCGFNVDLEKLLPKIVEEPKEIKNETRLEQIKKSWY